MSPNKPAAPERINMLVCFKDYLRPVSGIVSLLHATWMQTQSF